MFSWISGNNADIDEWEYPDLQTPVTSEDFEKIVNESIKHKLDWVNSNEWQLITEDGDILLEEMEIENSSITAVKATGILYNVNFDDLVHLAYDSTLAKRKEIFNDIVDHRICQEINDTMHVSHSKYSAPLGITGREFVVIRAIRKLEDGSTMIIIESINSQHVPHTGGYVRGTSSCCTLITPITDNEIKVVTIDHIDPRGWIPSFIVNSYKEKAIERLQKIQDLYGSKSGSDSESE